MKRSLLVALLTASAAVNSFAAPAKVTSYEVNVPFSFVANGKTVHAGQVVVECGPAICITTSKPLASFGMAVL